jgi:excisionase family DNA binding protein
MRIATSGLAPESPWLTVREAADYLRTSPAAIYKRISRKQLVAHRPEGSRIMLHRDELDASGPVPLEVL